MNIVILDAKTLGDDIDMSALDEFGSVTAYPTTTREETADRIKDADIVITNKVVMDQDVMSSATNLKLICIAATGVNNVDLNYASIRGVVVKNVTGYSTKSVVQHTFAMALYLLEKLAYHDHSVKSGNWHASGIFTDVSRPFFEISGKKWGIIGLGAIGQEVARVATAFGAEVSHYSTSGKNIYQPYTHLDLETLLQESDIISIHAPLNDNTKYLLNENNLHLIKEGAILLNLGRGGIINETDLAFELDRREFYAGVDVLEGEPIELDNSLMHIKHPERLLVTPHIAWTSIEAREKLTQGIIHNIEIFLEKYKKEEQERIAKELEEKMAREARKRAEEAIKEATRKEMTPTKEEEVSTVDATTEDTPNQQPENTKEQQSDDLQEQQMENVQEDIQKQSSEDTKKQRLEDLQEQEQKDPQEREAEAIVERDRPQETIESHEESKEEDKPKESIDDIIKKMLGKPLV